MTGAGGGNPGGFNVQQIAPVSAGGGGSPIGVFNGKNNPMIAPMPSQQQWPGLSSPYSFPANGPGGASPAMPGINGLPGTGQYDDTARGLRDAGVPSNIASSLATFMKSGSGYNKQVLQQLFAQLQPQVNRGEADIMEHFGAMGMGMSSPAAIGMGDFLSQVNLNEGQMATQLYEDSIHNYLSIMLGGSKNSSQDHPGFWQSLGESLMSSGIKAGLAGLGGGFSSMSAGGGFGSGFKSGFGGSLSGGG